MTANTTTDLQRLQQLIQRDRQRKLLAMLLLSGVGGVAITVQAVWVLALLTAGIAAGGAWQRHRHLSAVAGITAASEAGSQRAAARNHPLLPGTRGEQ
jgi:hypothetical protein